MPTLGPSALTSGLVLFAAGAWDAPTVAVSGCPDLSGERIAEHLMVEHPEFGERRGPRITVTCDETRVSIVVDDAQTLRRVHRTIEAPVQGGPGRERQVALATSSLIVASQTSEVHEAAPKAPPAAAPVPAPGSESTVSVQATTAVRVRQLPDGLVVFHAGLRAGWLPRANVELFGQASVESGQANRMRGQVHAFATFVGPGIAWTLRPNRRVGFETWAAVVAGYARLAGRTTARDVDANVVGGATGEVEVGFGPKFRTGAFVMVLDLRAGYTANTLRGTVTGEAPVQLGGLWTGVGLRVGGILRRPRD